MPSHAANGIFVNRTTLRNFEIFKDLTNDECEAVSRSMKLHRYVEGNYVIHEDHSCKDVFFILSGRIRTCSISREGKQIYYDDLLPGEMFGEFSAIDLKGRSADCRATETSLIAGLSGECFWNIMNRYPKVKDAVLRRVVRLVRQHMQRVSENAFYSVGQRVRFELIRLGTEAAEDADTVMLESVPTHDEIALKIGTRREAVTRELGSLQAKGLITWNRNQHVIHNLGELADHADR